MNVKTIMQYAFEDKYIEIKLLQQLPENLAKKYKLIQNIYYCGYVTVNRNNNDGTFKNYDEDSLEVHGGITYKKLDGDLITFGFDCGHAMDNFINCNLEYVKSECEKLAKQL